MAGPETRDALNGAHGCLALHIQPIVPLRQDNGKSITMPWHRQRRQLSAVLVMVLALVPTPAACFPGVFVGKAGSQSVAHTAHVVVMLNGPISVVTVMVDYGGELSPFALLMPVPPDVAIDRVRAVKREFVARLEQLSAPRFHGFFEQDPCDHGPTEQDWDVRYEASDSGFLAPAFLPPPERHWTVSNDISIATEPVFKNSESEFRFQILPVSEPREIEAWLKPRGYQAAAETLSGLARALERRKLLVAEVNPARAELLGDGGLQLGAIRYWSREPMLTISSTLGLLNSAGIQDLFLYVLHPTSRFEVSNYDNVFLPSNVEVDAAAAEQLAVLYNALFDAQLRRNPRSAVTEYVWPTTGCGEPCPNAPLTLNELMSLGGDIMEAKLVSSVARTPEPEPESDDEKQMFELQLQGKSTLEKAQSLRQHGKDRRELARRRAMMSRQRYIMTRLHLRYDRKILTSDISLQPAAEQLQGGIGIPQGPKGVLPNAARSAKVSHLQTRFVSLFAWPHSYQCEAPTRWRWARRWKSLDTALRKVWLASDLPQHGRDPNLLAKLIQTPIAELDIIPKPAEEVSLAPAQPKNVSKNSGCSACSGRGAGTSPFVIVAALVFARRIRKRR